MGKIAFAVHGGAGVILKKSMTPEREARVREVLNQSLIVGYKILRDGGTSLDAVTEGIVVLEDAPEFNAGRGAVFNHSGKHEMDAAIMSGKDLSAGAVAGISGVRNPIRLARVVMEKTPHVLLAGRGAEALAEELNQAFEPEEYFHSEYRWQQYLNIRDMNQIQLDHADSNTERKFGTVGVVALDQNGNLAAGVSTGGMTNKKFGRIGDSPIVGAGLYANNETCAISATGDGEFFIRGVVSYDIAARMAYLGENLETAANMVIVEKLTKIGGLGGVIAVDRSGNIAMPYNCDGMYRGYIDESGEAVVKIWGT